MKPALARLAFLSPASLTAIWTAVVLLSILSAAWPAGRALAGFAAFAFPVLWSYAVFSVCRQALADRGQAVARSDWVYALAILGLLATTIFQILSGLSEKPPAQSIAEMPVVLLIFVSAGLSGDVLRRTCRPYKVGAFNQTFLNAILLLFQPIGFWALRSQLSALKTS